MDNKSDYQLLIMKAVIESNRQDYDNKNKKLAEDLTAMTASMVDQIKISKSSPSIFQSLRILTLQSLLTRSLYHWRVGIIRKMVARGLSNMRSSNKKYINSSSRKN